MTLRDVLALVFLAGILGGVSIPRFYWWLKLRLALREELGQDFKQFAWVFERFVRGRR